MKASRSGSSFIILFLPATPAARTYFILHKEEAKPKREPESLEHQPLRLESWLLRRTMLSGSQQRRFRYRESKHKRRQSLYTNNTACTHCVWEGKICRAHLASPHKKMKEFSRAEEKNIKEEKKAEEFMGGLALTLLSPLDSRWGKQLEIPHGHSLLSLFLNKDTGRLGGNLHPSWPASSKRYIRKASPRKATHQREQVVTMAPERTGIKPQPEDRHQRI